MMRQERVGQLVGMLTESLSAERALASDVERMSERITSLRQDLAAREHELKELRGQLTVRKDTIAELEVRLREGNPDYAKADVERRGLKAVIAEAQNILDDMGVERAGEDGEDGPMLTRLAWARQMLKVAQRQANAYDDLDGPDRKEVRDE